MFPLVSGINSRLLSVNHALISNSDLPSPVSGTSSIGSIDSPLSLGYPLPPHSFILGLKLSFSANRSLLFLLLD